MSFAVIFKILLFGALCKCACPQLSQFFNFISGGSSQLFPSTGDGKMQAWQIHSYGDVKQLQLEQTSTPIITAGTQLLIKVKATGLNPIDLEMLRGYGSSALNFLRWYRSEFPLILGREFAGTVVAKGDCIRDSEFKIGDEVYGVMEPEKQGCQSEYAVTDRSYVLRRPEHLSVKEAASVLFTSITAWSALFLSGGLGLEVPSKTVILILGASGGVGTVAVQILKSLGVTVVGLCSTDAVPLVKSLGADYVYDYKDPQHVVQVASHGTYNIILDCAKYGYQKLPNEWNYKKFVTLEPPLANNTDKYGLILGFALSAGELFSANAPLIFSGKSVRWAVYTPWPSAMAFVDKLVKNKELKPVIQTAFKFNEVPQAYTRLAAGHTRGKIVIDLQ